MWPDGVIGQAVEAVNLRRRSEVKTELSGGRRTFQKIAVVKKRVLNRCGVNHRRADT